MLQHNRRVQSAPSHMATRPGPVTVPLRTLRAPSNLACTALASRGSVARTRSVHCRADVNWDAFRSDVEISSVGSRHRPSVRQYDFVVIGSGIAGLSYALKVAPYGKVAIITKDYANESCTQYAQGGVCAVLDAADSVDSHVQDTMVAGGFLNDRQAVEVVCREGPARVLELVKIGAEFTRNNDGTLHLTREGGHTYRRIVHAADLTGKEIERALLERARGLANIHFYEHHLAVDLVTDEVAGVKHCFGVDVLDQRGHNMCRFVALSTMLASGGAGQVYPNTTNPHVATGDGMAMAFRAGAAIANMEFVQFHPTALWQPPEAPGSDDGRTFLITEAVRGEGGLLRNRAGERFMPQYDERQELAPRDVVARAIHDQLLQHGEPHVWLDISHKPREQVLAHFPNIAAKCAALGIDITRDPIPVVPAQHYMCGGVQTGLVGDTSIQGLYACGEVTCSGLHGANRLASNSLLEGLVFADRAAGPSVAHAEYALKQCGRQLHYAAASADFSGARGARSLQPQQAAWAAAKRRELREVMWRCAGIVRTRRELRHALDLVAGAYVDARAALKAHGVCTELTELANLATVSELIVSCALQRCESRGLHFLADCPQAVEAECRPSLINTALKARYDLSGLKGRAAAVGPASGLAGAGAVVVPARVGGGAAGKTAPREVSVRSAAQDSV